MSDPCRHSVNGWNLIDGTCGTCGAVVVEGPRAAPRSDQRPAIVGGFVVKRREGRWWVCRVGVMLEHFATRDEAKDYADRRAKRELEAKE